MPPPIPAAIPHDKNGRLTIDLPCIQCGYNLRGLDPESTCPECGASISDSLRRGLLALADPGWLRRIRLGMSLMLTALAVIVVPLGGAHILLAMLDNVPHYLLALSILPSLLYFAGIWCFTMPDSIAGRATEPCRCDPR